MRMRHRGARALLQLHACARGSGAIVAPESSLTSNNRVAIFLRGRESNTRARLHNCTYHACVRHCTAPQEHGDNNNHESPVASRLNQRNSQTNPQASLVSQHCVCTFDKPSIPCVDSCAVAAA